MTQFYKKKVDTGSEEIVEKRFRNFMIMLYPEWGNFEEILQDLKGSFRNYAYIKHLPEADEKKEHVHFVLCLDNPRSDTSLAKRLGIDIRFVRIMKSLRGGCRYLTHIDNEDKIQYSLDQVTVSKSFKSDYYRAFDDLMSDDEVLDNIYNFIESYKNSSAIDLEIALTKFVCENGFEKIFKRYYNTISKYISYVSN